MNDIERLVNALSSAGPVAIAVSGGVDSMTLASFAHRRFGRDAVLAVHATSPAVPGEATRRVEHQAAEEGWTLRIIEAGEFSDPNYLANPVNRCFFCKTNLYGAIASATDRQILSGANLDDLGEYRPGLDAASNRSVRHPYVEAGIDKASVRRLARTLGLPEIADLPSAPCLSSRIETGIAIDAPTLRFVHAVERLVGTHLARATATRAIRCRIRQEGIVVELDQLSLAAFDADERGHLRDRILSIAPTSLLDRDVTFAPYRVGSAFLVEQAGASR